MNHEHRSMFLPGWNKFVVRQIFIPEQDILSPWKGLMSSIIFIMPCLDTISLDEYIFRRVENNSRR